MNIFNHFWNFVQPQKCTFDRLIIVKGFIITRIELLYVYALYRNKIKSKSITLECKHYVLWVVKSWGFRIRCLKPVGMANVL